MRRRVALRCRLFGHKPTAHRLNNHDWLGRPYPDRFSVAAHCRRCRADMTVTVQAQLVRLRTDEPPA